MEDCSTEALPNFQQQLSNLSQLQQQIERTKKELNQLLKIEHNEDKHLLSIYQLSLMTSRNKANQVLTQQHSQQQKHHQAQELQQKHDRVREVRQKQERDLREAREALRRSKEKEHQLIRDNSLRHEQAVRRNRHCDQTDKQRVVRQMRQAKENYKMSLADSRAQEQLHSNSDTGKNKSSVSGRPQLKQTNSPLSDANFSSSWLRNKLYSKGYSIGRLSKSKSLGLLISCDALNSMKPKKYSSNSLPENLSKTDCCVMFNPGSN